MSLDWASSRRCLVNPFSGPPLCAWIVSPLVGRLSEVCVWAGAPFCAVLAPKFSLHPCSSARCLTDFLGPWDLGIVWLPLIALMCFPWHFYTWSWSLVGLRYLGCLGCRRCTLSLLSPLRSFPSSSTGSVFSILVAGGLAMDICGVSILC